MTFVTGSPEPRHDEVLVRVGGVGLSVQCTPGTLAGLRVGESTHLPTSLVVREESLTLYGFADEDERVVFELLQTASGVGPRLAQAMLAVHSPDALRLAVATEDLAALTQVPGIGRKGAQRIVLELKDRLGAARGGRAGVQPRPVPAAAWRDQLHGALAGDCPLGSCPAIGRGLSHAADRNRNRVSSAGTPGPSA